MIEGTYRELPGLDLALTQAARLFGLRETTCRLVLDDLVRVAILRQSEDGRYLAGPGIGSV
jgi:DNA-binding IclR family transcriptional regulator